MQHPVKIIFTILSLVLFSSNGNAQSADGKLTIEEVYKNVEFPMPVVKETSFPNFEVNITEFGATGDGIFKNTEAIAKAINHVSGKGGGKVIIPSGIWLTGPITLKSNVNLWLANGAVLLFSRDFNDYPLQKVSFEGLNSYRCVSPINAQGAVNIAITGDGIIDGSGDAWRPVKKMKMTDNQWNNIVRSGGVLSKDGKMWFPSAGARKGNEVISTINFQVDENNKELKEIKDFLRPVMVNLIECKQVLLDGPTFQNSPAWNLHPLMCEDVIIRNLSIRNPWYSQNGDGLDLESCKNALVYNNTFDVGDDAICLKSGKDKDGRDRNLPTENVVIKNNVVYHAHGGFVVGSEMSGGVKNVHVSNCSFIGTDIGLRFKSTRGRGGVVENIYISNINMTNIVTEAIGFNLFYGGTTPNFEENDKKAALKEDQHHIAEETPSFRNIFMENIHVSGAQKAAFFMGLPEMNLKNINLKNSVLKADQGIEIIDADGMQFNNVKIISPKSAEVTIYNGKNLKFQSILFDKDIDAKVKVFGNKTQNISFSKKDFKTTDKPIIFSEKVKPSVITFE
ncbi:glycoside hydrolase family 28 protein [Flavobacterium ajazii]|uniref:glycoside hydrolase family 28 protein n=1 Tax=Flavobacterium ajazii TaxID=2692318 RepID=UPI0013D0119F|nr:glycoside hydrolase family 28 protein [Flavobacterium ajazii]